MVNIYKGFKRIAWIASILACISGWVLFFPKPIGSRYYIPGLGQDYEAFDVLIAFVIGIGFFIAVWFIRYLALWVIKGFSE